MSSVPFELHLTPHGWVIPWGDPSSAWEKKCLKAFKEGESKGLTFLAAEACPSNAHASCFYWREVLSSFMTDLCRCPEGEGLAMDSLEAPSQERMQSLAQRIPPVAGAEYQTPGVLGVIWQRWMDWVLLESKGELGAFLHAHAPKWTRVGRITLHLAENKDDEEFPLP
jgi:non-specific serine/threonine protein kinase